MAVMDVVADATLTLPATSLRNLTPSSTDAESLVVGVPGVVELVQIEQGQVGWPVTEKLTVAGVG